MAVDRRMRLVQHFNSGQSPFFLMLLSAKVTIIASSPRVSVCHIYLTVYVSIVLLLLIMDFLLSCILFCSEGGGCRVEFDWGQSTDLAGARPEPCD